MRVAKAAFVSAIFIVFSSFCQAEEKPYKIAVIIPLTGPVASLGGYVKNGINLAKEELPVDEKKLVELVYEDDMFEPAKTLSAYRKVNNSGNVDAVFVIGSSTANSLGPISERDKTILFAIGASDPTIAVGKEYSFIHWVIPPVLGNKLADALIEKDLKRVGFVTAEATGAVDDSEATIEALKQKNRTAMVVYNEHFLKDNTDFRTAFSVLRQKKVDAVVAVLFPGALSSFAKQFREAKLSADLIGIETFEDEAEVKAANGALLGAWYVNGSDPSLEFISSYKKKYKEHPGWAAGNGYDSLRLIAEAVRKVGRDNKAIANYLRNIKDYHGATGTFSSSGDNRFTLPASLKKITEKGFEKID